MQVDPISTQIRDEKDEFCSLWMEFSTDGVIDAVEIATLTPRLLRKSALIDQQDDGLRAAQAYIKAGETRRARRLAAEYAELHGPVCIDEYRARKERRHCWNSDDAS